MAAHYTSANYAVFLYSCEEETSTNALVWILQFLAHLLCCHFVCLYTEARYKQ